jgi:hypothetical protein
MRLIIIFFILLLISCKNKEKLADDRIAGDQPIGLLSEVIKGKIDSVTEEKYAQSGVISVFLTRLATGSIICMRPVFDSLFISDHGTPFYTYISGNRLYLVYSALELFNSNLKSRLISEKYDSICKVNKIGGLDFTNDTPASFYRIIGDQIIPYNNLAFENVFFERKPVDSINFQ